MQCSETGLASRQLQDKVGGVAPAGLFLDQAAAELLRVLPICALIAAHRCHSIPPRDSVVSFATL